MAEVDPDQFTKPGVITKAYYRDVYPAVDPTRADMAQTGKVTIVTGAGKGIGAGIAAAHAKAGVHGLVLVGRNLPNLENMKAMILAEHPSVDVVAVSTDITDERAVDQLFATVKAKFGTADTLINNAGIITPGFDAVDKVSSTTWCHDFDVNAKGTFLTNSGFLRLIRQTPVERPTVVNIVSNVHYAPPTLSSYFSAKAAAMKFTEVLQAENQDLTAYTLNPGLVNTDSTLEAFKPFAKDTPALIGAVTTYLAAKRPNYLKGRHLNTNWDVEELENRGDEIEKNNLFTLAIKV